MSGLRESLAEVHENLLFADGFDDAILGVVERCGMEPVVCYSIPVCLQILHDRDGMSTEDAIDFFHFNVLGAYHGPATPVWLTPASLDGEFQMPRDTDPEVNVLAEDADSDKFKN